jgi:hypothetical protein
MAISGDDEFRSGRMSSRCPRSQAQLIRTVEIGLEQCAANLMTECPKSWPHRKAGGSRVFIRGLPEWVLRGVADQSPKLIIRLRVN